jgi:lipid-binding SYLF domain-containing protein
MKMFKKITGIMAGLALCMVFTGISAKNVWAGSPAEINADVDATLERFYKEVGDGRRVAGQAKGVLVFPNVWRAGFGLGAAYGEGALRINGQTVDYYNTAAGSFGFQMGVQKKSIILLFMQDEVLDRLRHSSNWKAGVDAAVTLVQVGADGSVDTQKLNQPIVAFVIGQKGLMYNLTLEGTKFTKLDKSDYKN